MPSLAEGELSTLRLSRGLLHLVSQCYHLLISPLLLLGAQHLVSLARMSLNHVRLLACRVVGRGSEIR